MAKEKLKGTLPDNKRLQNLRDARRLINEILEDLDQSAHDCPTCNVKVKENMGEYVAAKALMGIKTSIKRVAGSLKLKLEQE